MKGQILSKLLANVTITYVVLSFSNFFIFFKILTKISSLYNTLVIFSNLKQQIFLTSASESSNNLINISLLVCFILFVI